MGQHDGQKALFSYGVDLERRVRADHPLRRVNAMIDFTFARAAVAHTYGENGNVSVDPVVLLKLMFLLFHENVRSERELVRRLPERLDWLWFLGYGLDEEAPNHSVLSKARARWGGELFEELFVRTVRQCVEAGLVDGAKVHLDGSLIDADASRDSVVKADAETIARIRAAYGAQERKLDETKPSSARCETNLKLVSTTDPDAPCVSKGPQSGTARPRYKHHRMVDDKKGVITAVVTTAGDVAEPAQTTPLLAQHRANTGKEVMAAVADRGYGTVENYCDLIAQGVRPHLSPMQPAGHKSEGLFTKEDFHYDEAADVYICPVGQRLKPRRFHQRRQMTDYVADKKVCAQCPLRGECTKSKTGRSIARHWKEAELEVALAFARLPEAQADRRRRRHLMEGSFAHAANRYHFKRARWRRLWRQQIQDWLIAAVQNVALLCGGLGAGVTAKPRPSPKVRRSAALFAFRRVMADLRVPVLAPWWRGTHRALVAA
ncbi:MAG: IS1182 family transposase [Verrucomicrobia bacterium]|nr:IS1182 family transposase [Verrucomicrobiota bacterium]